MFKSKKRKEQDLLEQLVRAIEEYAKLSLLVTSVYTEDVVENDVPFEDEDYLDEYEIRSKEMIEVNVKIGEITSKLRSKHKYDNEKIVNTINAIMEAVSHCNEVNDFIDSLEAKDEA